MSAPVQELERAISELAIADMVHLHERLIARIHDEADADGLDPAFRDEIRRRVQEIDASTAKSVDAFEALKEM
jgi:hypothetical protein